jgi:hypothetical protein
MRDAWENEPACPDSAAADVVQIRALIAQPRAAAPQALIDGDLGLSHARRLEKRLLRAEATLTTGVGLRKAARVLGGACRSLGG